MFLHVVQKVNSFYKSSHKKKHGINRIHVKEHSINMVFYGGGEKIDTA